MEVGDACTTVIVVVLVWDVDADTGVTTVRVDDAVVDVGVSVLLM